MTDKIDQALNEIEATLKPFMPRKQAQILIQNLTTSEEAETFADIILTLAERVKAMPHPYETDGQGKAATAQLHYFVGSYDAKRRVRKTNSGFRLGKFRIRVRVRLHLD